MPTQAAMLFLPRWISCKRPCNKEYSSGRCILNQLLVVLLCKSACWQKAGISSCCTHVNCEEHQTWVEYRGSYGETNPEPSLGSWAARGWSAAVLGRMVTMSTQGLVRPRPAPVWGDTALVNSQRSPLYPPVSERSQGCEDTDGTGGTFRDYNHVGVV